MKAESEAKIAKAKMDLEKESMDSQLMLYESIQAAKECYSRRYFSSITMINQSKDASAGNVIQNLVREYKLADKLTQGN